MKDRFSLAARALAAALVVGACENATEPAAVAGSAGSSDDTQCVGALPPGVYDNVVVPPNAICTITNSTIRGNVKALERSRLVMTNDQVGGSIEGDKANVVTVISSTIQGNVIIKEGIPGLGVPGLDFFGSADVIRSNLPNGSIQIEKNRVDVVIQDNILTKGNLKLEDNFSPPAFFFFVDRNQVAQNLQAFKNRGPALKRVQLNVVGQTLQCFENDPPFVGGPNTAEQAQGQCF
jgi:hypothetical protein